MMETIIDLAELNEQTFHDTAIRSEIIQLFIDQAPVIAAALAANAGQARADTAHRLKGSALALGARPLAEAAAALEAQPDNDIALADVRHRMDATLQALRHLSA
jgi:HPt (histidine-containing phosphotransfer) domain-containing protein